MTASDSNSFDEKHIPNEKEDDNVAFTTRQVDTAAELAAGDQEELDPVAALRVRCVPTPTFEWICMTDLLHGYRRKIDLHIMPLMCRKWMVPYP